MIDTVKIITIISEDIFEIISSKSNCKTSYNLASGEIFYKIITDNLEGSYSSSLSVKLSTGIKYGLFGSRCLEVEGSLHKILKGQNAYEGFYSLQSVALGLIKLVENAYDVKLPKLKHWFLQRVDIAICYDLENNDTVCKYINNLSQCNYPRRNIKFYENESIYVTGRYTTLKIYNKLREFKKNDFSKLKDTFDVFSYSNKIQGYIRYEVEIKKRKLVDFFERKNIRVDRIFYDDLFKIWESDFMKLLKFFDNDLNKISDKDKVENRLKFIYGERRGRTLYNFYLTILVEGLRNVKNKNSKTWYYRNIKDLKDAGVDLSQSYKINIEESEIIDFNPFSSMHKMVM